MIDDIKQDTKERMDKSLEALAHNFNKIRTGRAHPSLLDSIRIEYYGAETPLNQLANINIDDARTLSVVAFDKACLLYTSPSPRDATLSRMPSSA